MLGHGSADLPVFGEHLARSWLWPRPPITCIAIAPRLKMTINVTTSSARDGSLVRPTFISATAVHEQLPATDPRLGVQHMKEASQQPNRSTPDWRYSSGCAEVVVSSRTVTRPLRNNARVWSRQLAGLRQASRPMLAVADVAGSLHRRRSAAEGDECREQESARHLPCQAKPHGPEFPLVDIRSSRRRDAGVLLAGSC